MAKGWRDGYPDLTRLSDGQRFHLLFEEAVHDLLLARLGVEGRLREAARLVVFIDDLDRCEEQAVVTLLEAIKLYLSTPRCVFVLGIDDTALLKLLPRVWKDRGDDSNREYLEKLFQAMVALPLPRQANVCKAVEQQLQNHDFPDPAALATDVANLLEPNPRKIKNFTNSLCAMWRLYDIAAKNDPIRARRFVMFQYLRLYHRPVWRLLERQPAALPYLKRALSENRNEVPDLPDSPFGYAEQELLLEFFSRAFSHVLPTAATSDDERPGQGRDFHHLPLEQAVTLFQERLDRKRSDDYFVKWFIESENVGLDEPLDECLLRLPDPPAT